MKKVSVVRLDESVQRILGIDPGLAASGWGVVEQKESRVSYVAHGCIETTSGQNHAERLLAIYKEIKSVIKKWKPETGAIESLYFARNAKSAMPVAEASGVLRMAIAEAGIPVYEYNPNEIKKAITGVARAEKSQVQEMTRLILGLEKIPCPDHSADALGAAICCAHSNLYQEGKVNVKRKTKK
ncbi:MAG: crossover junction endodeoxyribonuclease RuvC [Spirochaetaceae bacterium]|nr:crossover junction endodeoxyribonuclease RuvC [Spirochaetaceae bacterium]